VEWGSARTTTAYNPTVNDIDILEWLGTGQTVTVRPTSTPGLGGYRGAGTLWDEHTVVVADGRVFDVYGPADGVPIDDWKALWDYPEAINFGGL